MPSSACEPSLRRPMYMPGRVRMCSMSERCRMLSSLYCVVLVIVVGSPYLMLFEKTALRLWMQQSRFFHCFWLAMLSSSCGCDSAHS